MIKEKKYRTIWISDIHLGTKGCKAEFLLDFLRQHDAEYLYLVGDIIDGWQLKKNWLALLGDWAYSRCLEINQLFNVIRRTLGYPYWSLSAYLKHRVKKAVSFIAKFEETLALEAKKRHVDGIVCGHIHHYQIRDINGVLYCNDGDWVENCTALVENWSGELSIVHWTTG